MQDCLPTCWVRRPTADRVGSPPAWPAAHHRGRVSEPFQGSHVRSPAAGQQRRTGRELRGHGTDEACRQLGGAAVAVSLPHQRWSRGGCGDGESSARLWAWKSRQRPRWPTQISAACTPLRIWPASDCGRASSCTQAGKPCPSAPGCGPCRWKLCGPRIGEDSTIPATHDALRRRPRRRGASSR